MTTKSKTAISAEQVQAGHALAEQLREFVSVEAANKEALDKVKATAKEKANVARAHLNLALKALHLSKFRWTGTAKSNPIIKELSATLLDSGLKDTVAANALTAIKFCYENRYQLDTLNPSRQKAKKTQVSLLDGKEIKIDRGEKHCAGDVVAALKHEGFEQVCAKALARIADAADIDLNDHIDNPALALVEAFKLALVDLKLATLDGDEVKLTK